MPDSLLKILKKLIAEKSSGEYLFQSSRGLPYGKNNMSMRYKRIIDSFNFPENNTLYSWKHTGVVRAYKEGIKIKSIQRQCRHYSILETDTYLKSMGLYGNEELQSKMPDLSQFE